MCLLSPILLLTKKLDFTQRQFADLNGVDNAALQDKVNNVRKRVTEEVLDSFFT